MTILVTGATGFIGYHTVKRLIEGGIEVVGIDTSMPTMRHAQTGATRRIAIFARL